MKKYFCDKCGIEITEECIYLDIRLKVHDTRMLELGGEKVVSAPIKCKDSYVMCIKCFDERTRREFYVFDLRMLIKNSLGIKEEIQ